MGSVIDGRMWGRYKEITWHDPRHKGRRYVVSGPLFLGISWWFN